MSQEYRRDRPAMPDLLTRLTEAIADRYAIQRVLGQGGTATVFLADDLRHFRQVAIKLLKPDLAYVVGPDRFLREIRITASLQHPHILPLLDSGEVDGIPFYVMPYVEGESLSDRLNREGPLDIDDAVGVLLQISSALAYAHERGIVHRDLKPENILVTGDQVTVADFGIALALSSVGEAKLTGTGIAIGTVPYMSPEQATGERDLDPRTDQYALGCVCYDLLTGRPPFTGPNIQSVIAMQVTAQPPPLAGLRPDVPGPLARVIERMLAKAPNDRYETIAEFVTALKGARDSTERAAGIGGLAPSSAVEGGPRPRSVAVLPFLNLSSDPDNEFLSDGISEEIIHVLSKVPEARVAARTSAFAFKGSSEDVRTIGERLSVSTVLEGSVRRAHDRVRVTARLVDTQTGYELWSERYERKLDDVFAIQDEIARAIVHALRISQASDTRDAPVESPTDNFEAYELYLRGRYAWNKRTEEGLGQSVAYLRRAVAIDGEFALAWTGLAEAYTMQGIYGAVRPQEVMPLAKQTALQAAALDPELAEPVVALGCVQAAYEWDWEAAEASFRNAIAVNADYPTAHQWYAVNCLIPQQRFPEARSALAQAAELDPLSLAVQTSAAVLIYFERNYPRVVGMCRTILESDPSFGLAHYFLGRAYSQMGEHEAACDALATARELSRKSPETTSALAHAHALAGNQKDAGRLLQELERLSKQRYVSPLLIAQVHLGLGEIDRAFAALDMAYEERSAELQWLCVQPIFDEVRTDSRFISFVQRIHLDR